ncbi:hypothetical protein M409DRAFT_71284 [Zasmidium cellare ATCC 36951]|uniref:Uncharacterized protein n=1 Tax=Zasmidium cellare ATCC 36951 TaxID=1080233 RepID=A0A6A6BWG8_ZASCE|nr:uncharacterized protein M409DRAFT_71284 [Zasmidium cellare ATCC 36951]KAF2159035.1 hypothetical protein M409DRAFT_71284 [Zasmidium cellare ATCC 36951]
MKLSDSLPWTKSPLVINAPMGGIAQADLAIAVSKAGGLGQIGVDYNLEAFKTRLSQVEDALGRHNGLLPIGVGFLSFIVNSDAAVDIVGKFKPAVVWVFAANALDDYTGWAEEIQVGNVEAALRVAEGARPDVLCVQGADAGGHGFEKEAGIISLLPEISDALAEAGHDITAVAAGGIADGRAGAAALNLGAQGVVLGTRFLSAPETKWQSTVRAKLFDELRGPNRWPNAYDGRSIRMKSFEEYKDGVDIDEIRKRHAEAIKGPDAGFGAEGRTAMWAGSGVGLVKKEQPAAEIVGEIRQGIVEAMDTARTRL